ncbi:putative quinol monooxygenase [Clostridium estertheticum]|uniref:Antibiotic biosynthesis monooxygenase n=1 Tax=Clostridium estertheticum TaxID=238834 RepID=A0AA47EKS4_9CLOT|nr:putative quinol monooxygenase [Clostridium estertheticum]MBU3157271.1 antibiotic biosynthesis monooxygenase [Clostridium estertheticum]MBU3201669.1 antibiotic biosynthesis monooxygenase [Clostridium estertheticum]MBX4266852.1 antibiotic biosynthesis monooxygenase [Clostridium estertheticum]MBX4271303.1 antibiotic biosynthesis monooxygenase [Clostridium estertheticum]MCB2355738.1 antibiotic biosynthesis monooxygenase [Clostridium estertheticum]
MITIVAKNSIKQGKTEEFKNLAEKLINESRKEKGNVSYTLYQDANDNNIFTFIEEWENEDIIKSHNASTHFTSIVPKFADLIEKKSEINLYKKIK